MSILNNKNTKAKQDKKAARPNTSNSKFITKPTKSSSAQKPHKAGGTRGS